MEFVGRSSGSEEKEVSRDEEGEPWVRGKAVSRNKRIRERLQGQGVVGQCAVCSSLWLFFFFSSCNQILHC